MPLAGRSKGCAIVQYASFGDAQRAMLELNNTMVKDRLIFVREDREGGGGGGGGGFAGGAAPRGSGAALKGSSGGGSGAARGAADGRRVYVGNLSWDCKWQDLKDHMRSVGEVLHADVMMGADGRSKGCALVEYQSAAEAQRAIEELTDTEIMGRKIFVREDRETGQ